MTPLAVIDAYLRAVRPGPREVERLLEVLSLDADLLGRWLVLLAEPAEPEAVRAGLERLATDEFEAFGLHQGLSILTVLYGSGAGDARVAPRRWRTMLVASLLAGSLAADQGIDPEATQWRTLLGMGGVSNSRDASLAELLAFRGARLSLLEGTDPLLRIFAVVDRLDLDTPEAAQAAAELLLAVRPLEFQQRLRAAEAEAEQRLERCGIDLDPAINPSEQVWATIRIAFLTRALTGVSRETGADSRLADLHGVIARMLFRDVPQLLLLDASGEWLDVVGVKGPRVKVDSHASVLARCARLAERGELLDGPEAAVVDRQLLRSMGSEAGLVLPICSGPSAPLIGVLVAPLVDEDDLEIESTLEIYAQMLGARLSTDDLGHASDEDEMASLRRKTEARLRELVHEANNPLSIVQNYLHILKLTLAQQPKAVEQLELVGAELKRVASLLLQVREVPKEIAEEGSDAPRLMYLDLVSLIARLVEMHRGYAERSEATVSAQLPDGPVRLVSDEGRIAQIITNLLRNALEADRGHAVRVELLPGAFREGREGVQIVVGDTGPGVPREVMARLGHPKQSAKGGEHAGLGLMIVDRLVRELSGTLDVRSTPGQGTVFSVFLPLAA